MGAMAVGIGKPSDLTAGADLTGTQVYFGDYTGGASTGAIPWYVVATDANTATLWTTTSMGNRAYEGTTGQHNFWSGSDIAHWLNGTGATHSGNGFLQNAFSAAERAAIVSEYGAANEPYITGTIDSRQPIVLPSVAEIGNGAGTGTWNINQATRAFGDSWWLRSPSSIPFSAAFAYVDGDVYVDGDHVSIQASARPAFKLNLASAIFTSAASAASGKNSVSVGDGLVAASTPSDAVKFTIEDAGLSLTSTATVGTVKAGDTVSMAYSGATTGASNYVSCVIENGAGAVLFYGKLASADVNNSGTASFIVPSATNLPNGSYTIKLFVEEANGENETDFASVPVEISMTVDNTAAPIITLQPLAQNVMEGQSATFTVAASGNPAPMYQWQVSTDNGANWNAVSGATSATLTLSGVALSENGNQYRCVVSNGVGAAVTSNAVMLTVTAFFQGNSTASIPALSPVGLVVLALVLGAAAFRRRRV
jgi:hypothetical protein